MCFFPMVGFDEHSKWGFWGVRIFLKQIWGGVGVGKDAKF